MPTEDFDCPTVPVVLNKTKDVRTAMTDYWHTHSKQANVQEMMLDENAEALLQDEQPEVLGMIPEFKDKDVIELGAGIGRFTRIFAKGSVRKILAVEFMETFMNKNKAVNGSLPNVEFFHGDVLTLERKGSSADLIFSNWLLMYLDDEEVRTLGKSILTWLRVGGNAYFRESCFHNSGNRPRESNPTFYRDPAKYNALFQSVTSEEDGEKYGFGLEFSKSIHAYVKHKNNPNQICWLFTKQKLSPDATGYKSFQEFLDTQQYSRNGILRYERIFGRHFVSTGGKETTEEFVKMLDLKPGQRVLDIGAGIGGSAFHMAEKYGAEVLGVDLSSNMISIALERLDSMPREILKKVSFEVADATKREYEPESYDVIYSRDTILHIPDKETLFARFLKFLKPGGKLLITDYCCSEGEHSDDFKKYVAQRGYALLSPAAYGKVLQKVGFVNVKANDQTEQFAQVLKTELERSQGIKDSFIQEFSEKDYNYIIDGWKDKVVRVGKGDQRWGLFYAEKAQ